MSGRTQHEIPRCFQRGFRTARKGNVEYIYIFRRGKTAVESPIKKSAAQRHFYSNPSTEIERSLDDKITKYENRLCNIINKLRNIDAGSVAPPDMVAEVIVHLTIRNDHIRGAFRDFIPMIAEKFTTNFGKEEILKRLVGIDKNSPTEIFKSQFMAAIKERGIQIAQNDVEIFERFAFNFFTDNFYSFYNVLLPQLSDLGDFMKKEASSISKNSHNKTLAKSLLPLVRVEALCQYNWIVVPAEVNSILPDCVSVAYDSKYNPFPYILCNMENTENVTVPISRDKIIVGYKDKLPEIDIHKMNFDAALCSNKYFLSPENSPYFSELSEFIGKRRDEIVENSVNDASSEIFGTEQN